MTKKSINKLSDKLSKANESFQVYMYDNGYMFEIGGVDHSDNWCTIKIICPSLDEVFLYAQEANEMERNN